MRKRYLSGNLWCNLGHTKQLQQYHRLTAEVTESRRCVRQQANTRIEDRFRLCCEGSAWKGTDLEECIQAFCNALESLVVVLEVVK